MLEFSTTRKDKFHVGKTALTPEQKVSILRRHLLENVPVSDLCELFENAAPLFERRTNSANHRRQQDAQAKKVADLEAKLQKKNEVVAELLEEHVQLKKELGEP